MADFTNPTNDELLYTFAAKNGDTLTTKNGSKWIWQGGQWYPFAFGSESKIQNLTATLSDGGIGSSWDVPGISTAGHVVYSALPRLNAAELASLMAAADMPASATISLVITAISGSSRWASAIMSVTIFGQLGISMLDMTV